MKRVLSITPILMTAIFFAAGPAISRSSSTIAGAAPKASFHIGIVTGTLDMMEEEYRGAEKLIEEYGKSSAGGIITHITYKDDFMWEQETVISDILALAKDPLMKAIIVSQAIPGTAEAFRRIREKNPNILLFAAEAHEDPLVIESVADMVVTLDYVARGYLIPWAAKELGAKKFVFVSFRRHMSYDLFRRMRAIMEEACKDLGIEFVFEDAPDPLGDNGVPGAQQFIIDNVPEWIEKYGPDASFFCTNDAHLEPLLMMLFREGAGIFVESTYPSPYIGYPAALGLDLSEELGDYAKIFAKVEMSVKANNGAGRFGTWAYSCGFTNTAGLGEFAIRIINKKAKKDSFSDLLDAFENYTPGAKWNGSNYSDGSGGPKAENHYQIYQDTYVFGKGFLPTASLKVPDKYFSITFQSPN